MREGVLRHGEGSHCTLERGSNGTAAAGSVSLVL